MVVARAPSSVSQPPTVITVTRIAESTSRTTTIAFVVFDAAVSRLGCSMTGAGVAMAGRLYDPGAWTHGRVWWNGRHAGFRCRWRKPWGFESLHPHGATQTNGGGPRR